MAAGNGATRDQREVLVVEDDAEINRLVGAYVEFAGLRYVAALDGAAALEQIRTHAPCAVILDLMLPDLSGWEICRRLKSDRDTYDIPIIILTALDSENSKEEGIRCGVAEYLTKPFNPDEFLEVLGRYAANHEPQTRK